MKHLTCWVPVANDGQRIGAKIAILAFIVSVPSTVGLAGMDMHVHQGEHSHTIASGQWEGSAEGIAYSEINHGLAGLGVILVGPTALRTAMGWPAALNRADADKGGADQLAGLRQGPPFGLSVSPVGRPAGGRRWGRDKR